jgi:hypothetical protein
VQSLQFSPKFHLVFLDSPPNSAALRFQRFIFQSKSVICDFKEIDIVKIHFIVYVFHKVVKTASPDFKTTKKMGKGRPAQPPNQKVDKYQDDRTGNS